MTYGIYMPTKYKLTYRKILSKLDSEHNMFLHDKDRPSIIMNNSFIEHKI